MSEASETLYSGVKLRIGDICYLDSEASKKLLVVDKAISGICYMCVWMVRMSLRHARVPFFPPKTQLFRLDPSFL